MILPLDRLGFLKFSELFHVRACVCFGERWLRKREDRMTDSSMINKLTDYEISNR